MGGDVRVCLPVAPRGDDAAWAHAEAREAGVPIQTDVPHPATWRDAPWVVDGLFGIGLNRGLSGVFAEIAAALSAHAAQGGQVLALDIPSGLDAWTGKMVGSASAVEASHTLTFLAAKPGLFTGQGRDLCGHVLLAPLGLDDEDFHTARAAAAASNRPPKDASGAEPPSAVQLNAPERFMPAFLRRRPSSHKGTFGSLAIIGGDTGMCGAAILAARAALYCGVGRVSTALIGDGAPPYDPPHPEIMLRRIDAIALDTMDALAIGPGMGRSDHAAEILRTVIDLNLPKLIDADALNLISTHGALLDRVRVHGEKIVITPHPAEAARLLGVQVKDIEADRIAALRQLVAHVRCTVVLKGSGTLIGTPDGRIALNATGNTGLSTGGSGDVLSGVTGAFLAQQLPPYEAALAAAFVHGRAAETLSDDNVGPVGLSAGELASAIRRLLNALHRRFHLI
jgi:hydroxyethylthiazole kinase-like uncharacterized protein yjeF